MKVSVVVVDDEGPARYIVKRVVQALDRDCEFVEFESGFEFMAVVKDEERRREVLGSPPPPALVLLDINMPEMSGFEVLEELSRLDVHDVRLMVVTMYSSSNLATDRADAFRHDFVEQYVVKPITPETLEALVADLLEKYGSPD